MKIIDTRVIVTCPSQNFVALKVLTGEGYTVSVVPRSMAAYLPVNRLQDSTLFNW